jgi:hypothetical protein
VEQVRLPEGEANNINQATPAIRDLARLLLTLETNQDESAEREAHATLSTVAKLRWHLTKLVGLAGFQALLARALALARPEADWLEPVRVTADAVLEGFHEAAQCQSAETVAEGSTALLAQLLGLLVTFIGQALTLRLVREVWPEAAMDKGNSGAEETPA